MDSKLLDYFLRPERLDARGRGILVDIDEATVYSSIEAILGVTGRSFWGSNAEYLDGYSRVTETAMRLLMDGSDRIIRAIWEMRGVPDATLTPTALGLYPGTPEENEIRSLWLSSEGTRNLVNDRSLAIFNVLENIEALLSQIRDQEGGFTAEEKAQLLGRLAAIFAAL